MENGLKKVSDFFSGRKVFSIPDYQRAYAWESTKHLSDFIDDIENIKVGKDYFFGTVLLQEKDDKINGNDVIDIVDGQQRITTVVIFMYELIKKIIESKTMDKDEVDTLLETYIKYKKSFKINAISADNDYFQTYILGDLPGEAYIKTPSQRRLFEAKKYFSNYLKDKNTEVLLQLKDKIDGGMQLLTYSVKDTSEATLIFETTNDRGKGLTNLEKVKSFLMYKAYLASKEGTEDILNIIKIRFSEIYREIEQSELKIDEDNILQYHTIAFEKWSDKEHYQRNVYSLKKYVNKLILDSEDDRTIQYIDKYTRELKETFIIVNSLLSDRSPAIRDIFLLERVGNFWPLLIKTYKYDNDKSKEKFYRICRLLEIFSFRVYAINKSRANTGQSTIFTLARNFKGVFGKLEQSLIEMIQEYSSKQAFRSALQDSSLYEWMSTKDINYFFWKYENYLRTSIQPIGPAMSEDEYMNKNKKYCFTIEHIASQNPKITKNAGVLSPITEEFKEKYLHSLGNLTFDPKSSNSSKGNNGFSHKNSKYFIRAPYKTHNELDYYIVKNKWNSKSITNRSKKLVEWAIVHWNPIST